MPLEDPAVMTGEAFDEFRDDRAQWDPEYGMPAIKPLTEAEIAELRAEYPDWDKVPF